MIIHHVNTININNTAWNGLVWLSAGSNGELLWPFGFRKGEVVDQLRNH
jgi:hypothetical protein